MDIIAIKGMRSEMLELFFREWWPVWGVLKKVRGWTFIFVRGTTYFGTVNDYASLISGEIEKLVIYINGKSGVIDQFNIYDGGQLCPVSKDHAEGLGKGRIHSGWFIKNRVALWSLSNEAQRQVQKLLGEVDVDTSNKVIRMPVSASTLNQQLAITLFDAWRLPRVWSHDNLEEAAKEEDSTVI